MKMVNSNSFNTPAACCGEIYFSVRVKIMALDCFENIHNDSILQFIFRTDNRFVAGRGGLNQAER